MSATRRITIKRKRGTYEKEEKQTKSSVTAKYGSGCVICCSTIYDGFGSRSKRNPVHYLKRGFTGNHVCGHEPKNQSKECKT